MTTRQIAVGFAIVAIAALLIHEIAWPLSQVNLGIGSQTLAISFRLPDPQLVGASIIIRDGLSSNASEASIGSDGAAELSVEVSCTTSTTLGSRETVADALRVLVTVSPNVVPPNTASLSEESEDNDEDRTVPLSMIIGRRRLTNDDFADGIVVRKIPTVDIDWTASDIGHK